MTKIVAILGGGDWADASVEHIEVPNGMDLEVERNTYREWLRNTTSGACFSFAGFLKTRGATDTDKVEEYWEY